MKELSDSEIFLDKESILSAIKQYGSYLTNEVKIQKWDGVGGAESYLIEIFKGGVKFNGVLNDFFEREGYGIHNFENGDKYFGFFKEDKRNLNGIYFWPSVNKDGRILSEMYYGNWKDDKKDNNGIYVWLDESEEEKDFENTNLEAYVGKFEDGTYSEGTYLQKTGENYYLYYGKFTKDGLKNDEKGFFYSSNLDRIFHGKFVNDVFVEGYIASFNSEEGKIEDLVFCNFDENLNVTNLILEKDLQEEEKESQSKICSLFRDVILGIDYFGELYQKVKIISEFVDENMGDISVFNNQEKFPLVIKLSAGYSRNNIYNDILTKVFGYKLSNKF